MVVSSTSGSDTRSGWQGHLTGVVLALAVLAGTLIQIRGETVTFVPPATWVECLIFASAGAALLAHRFPYVALGVAAVLDAVPYWLPIGGAGYHLSLMIAVYMAMAKNPTRQATPVVEAAFGLQVGLMAWNMDWHWSSMYVAAAALTVALPAALGLASHSRSMATEALRQRALAAGRSREADARELSAEDRLRTARELHDSVAHQIAVDRGHEPERRSRVANAARATRRSRVSPDHAARGGTGRDLVDLRPAHQSPSGRTGRHRRAVLHGGLPGTREGVPDPFARLDRGRRRRRPPRQRSNQPRSLLRRPGGADQRLQAWAARITRPTRRPVGRQGVVASRQRARPQPSRPQLGKVSACAECASAWRPSVADSPSRTPARCSPCGLAYRARCAHRDRGARRRRPEPHQQGHRRPGDPGARSRPRRYRGERHRCWSAPSASPRRPPRHRAPKPQAPTFADYIPEVAKAVSPGTKRVYGTYWNRILGHWGDGHLDEPTTLEI